MTTAALSGLPMAAAAHADGRTSPPPPGTPACTRLRKQACQYSQLALPRASAFLHTYSPFLLGSSARACWRSVDASRAPDHPLLYIAVKPRSTCIPRPPARLLKRSALQSSAIRDGCSQLCASKGHVPGLACMPGSTCLAVEPHICGADP
jgi:hypothetical protein